MKTRIAAILLSLSFLSGCTSTAVVTVPETAEPDNAPEQTHSSGDALRTGLFVQASVAGSSSAMPGNDGIAKGTVDLIAVTVDDNGVIDQCVIDALPISFSFDGEGHILSNVQEPLYTKTQLGDSYGMRDASGIGREWYEQAQALASYVEGKTLAQIQSIALTESGAPADAALSASVTISIAGYLDAIASAIASADHHGAKKGDLLVLRSAANAGKSLDAAGSEDGKIQTDVSAAALTFDGDTITSCCIDALQAVVAFDTAGQITTDLTATQPSKIALGDRYGMRSASGIGREWYEQAAAFSSYVTGKTPEEVAQIAVHADGSPEDTPLASSVTISIGDFLSLISDA